MSSKINLQTCEYARKSSIFQDNQLIYALNQTTTRISEIIEFVLTEKSQKTTIRCIEATNYNFQTVFQASKIIIAVSDAEEVSIENISLGKNFLGEIQTAFTERFLAYHKRIVQLGEMLEELNIKRSLFKTKEILDAEPTIFFLKKGLVEMRVLSLPFQTDENCGLYKQIIGRRKLLLEYEKIQEDGYIIRNYLKDGKRIAIFADIPDGKTQKISRWFALRDEDIFQMIFDENDLLEEMYNIGEEETDQLLGLILDFLKSYDKERDKNLLLLAEKLINILEKYSMDSTILTINRLQIIARKRELELEERKTLAQIKYSENIFARCCACILLKQFDEFDIHMQQLSATEKEEFYSWPIASLLPNVEKNE